MTVTKEKVRRDDGTSTNMEHFVLSLAYFPM